MEPRSRLHAASDRESLVSPQLGEDKSKDSHFPPELNKYLTDHVFLMDEWHNNDFFSSPEDEEVKSAWRNKERLKTVGVALVLCLNIGTDPPESLKPSPCARKECWIEPNPQTKAKSLELIGNSLQKQYEKWQPKAKFKQCLDPTPEDLHRVCANLRKCSKQERLLLHYNGHGAPRPTKNGELWTFGKNYTHYMPVPVSELRQWLGDPCIYVLDCSGAGSLIPHLVDTTPADIDFFSAHSSGAGLSSVAEGGDGGGGRGGGGGGRC